MFTAWYESLTDQAVAERWRACGPWMQAMLPPMCPLAAVESLPSGRRLVGLAASSLQAPGATGTDERLPSALDLVSLPLLAVCVSDVHTGATLTPCPLAPGDVAGADRGDAPWQGLRAAVQQGADRIVRLQPFRVVRGDAAGAPVERCATWKRQRLETRRPLAVARGAPGGQQAGRG